MKSVCVDVIKEGIRRLFLFERMDRRFSTTMRITQFTDYALRLLMYLSEHQDRVVPISEVAEYHDVSIEHMRKVFRKLTELGYITTQRGARGGLKLAGSPADINLGLLFRQIENLSLISCHDGDAPCRIQNCKLSHTLDDALRAFISVLDGKSMADVL